ncbi:MAG: DNA repair protein RecN [Clostridia bacterium]|nr:DNA repair protein RecN [Clostridia bacterium]
MIESLHIENIAVLKSLDVDFSEGMTVLSGETGAGKSIIIDSLGLLLGAKADRELIRTGETKATVSAVFSDIGKETADKLSEMGFETEDGTVMLARSMTSSGSSARINGRAVTVSMLREVGGALFNIHGQNDNQQLLDQKNHIKLLDSFAGNTALLLEYSAHYRDILRIRGEIDSMKKDVMEQNRLREMLRYQLEDIDSVKLKEGEEETLNELVKKLRSLEKINKCCALVEKALRGGEKSLGAVYLADRAAGALDSVSDAVPDAAALSERLNNIRYELEDIAESVYSLCDFGDGDPTAKLDRAESRLNAISKLKRKYGSTVEEILEFRKNAAERLDLIENAGERAEDLANELKEAETAAGAVADKLSAARKKAAKSLDGRVCETLAFLDMPKVRFEVSVKRAEDFTAYGCDRVEFLISTNPGEPLLPMEMIASGGELARIMLSLKNVLNECDGVGTVIFDEIDTGISGKTSRKVGIKLKEIARGAQVLCVTHSAQIASVAHNHLYISKSEEDGRVSTRLRLLDREGRVEEIARILGGIEITDAVRSAAVEMIAEGETY